MLTFGDVLADRYRLHKPIAAGGAGLVWWASDTLLKREVAVKVLYGEHADDDVYLARLRDEARILAALHHPGVARMYDYGESEHGAYLVMDYVEGQTLAQRLAFAGRLSSMETMTLVSQAARALHAVHEAGVVHRDVKPGNLICATDGTVVLVDFGIAQVPDAESLTDLDEVIGTPRYIAPEQVAGGITTPATDVYSLGAVAYRCLAGRPAFLGDDPVAVALRHLNDQPPPLPPDVPAPVRDLVLTAMAKDPADRYPSAEALAVAAERLTACTCARGVAPVIAQARRHRPREVLSSGVLVALAIIVGILAWAGPIPIGLPRGGAAAPALMLPELAQPESTGDLPTSGRAASSGRVGASFGFISAVGAGTLLARAVAAPAHPIENGPPPGTSNEARPDRSPPTAGRPSAKAGSCGQVAPSACRPSENHAPQRHAPQRHAPQRHAA